ncbi:MAG: TrkA family potassium uptake protein [Anaerolineaceae bacterium]|jgi:trk system potassium uptake protein TrkA|nr:TrkA family potassium uptake protein [Anaerolineaceae bacterium]
MKAIIVGCGRIGAELAYRLFKRGHEVSIIDNVPASFNNLPPNFEGRVHEGDALNQDVLIRAGIEHCDVVAAVTNNDALNMVVSHVSKSVFNVPNVVARNYDPHVRELFETFGIQVVSSTGWGAQRIEELMYHSEVRTVFSAGNGEVEVYELTINAAWNDQTVADLIPCEECKPIAVSRAGKAFLADGSTTLKEGDILNVAATFDGIEKTRHHMESRVKEA